MQEQVSALGSANSEAEALLKIQHGYWTIDATAQLPEEPPLEEYKEQKDELLGEINKFFSHSIDYYPHFDEIKYPLAPWRWHYFISIYDRRVVECFPRDHDLRKFISAFRIAAVKNQIINIRKKRILQSISTSSILLIVLCILFRKNISNLNANEILADPLNLSNFTDVGIASIASGVNISLFHLVLFVTILISVIVIFLSRIFLSQTTTNFLRSFEVDAVAMDNKMGLRLNNIRTRYTDLSGEILKADAVDKGVYDPEFQQFPVQAKWWFELLQWWPWRVFYAERFLQSEMQKLRIFIRWSGIVGNLTSVAITLSFILISYLIIFLGGIDLSKFSNLAPFLIFVVSAFVISWYSTWKKFSLHIEWLNKYLGKHDWPKFADFNVLDRLSDHIRVAMNEIRDEKLKGIQR